MSSPIIRKSAVALVPDDTGCKHGFLGPTRKVDSVKYGPCLECLSYVAIELDTNSQRTGRTWLVKHVSSDSN